MSDQENEELRGGVEDPEGAFEQNDAPLDPETATDAVRDPEGDSGSPQTFDEARAMADDDVEEDGVATGGWQVNAPSAQPGGGTMGLSETTGDAPVADVTEPPDAADTPSDSSRREQGTGTV